MKSSLIVPSKEEKRLAALRKYEILDTPADGSFDDLTALAAKMFNVPIAIVSLVDTNRIWFKSHYGLEIHQIDRDPGLCASAILSDDIYLVEDAKNDPRCLANPLVAGAFGLQFYAAAPVDHPLRGIKRRVDAVLQKLSPLFDELYEKKGRPSIPPEQLLKARVLTALYSVRSERLFCEQLGYNLLWLWFLDRELAEGSFDHSIFAKNYERVLSAEVARLFFIEVYELSREEGWTSDAHFSTDGTLIDSWASLKSFVRKDGGDQKKIDSAKDDDPGNPTISFRGEKRKNDTHQSTTDPDSVLYCKAHGREARLVFGGHLLMENRHGLCADITLHNPIAQPEPRVALRQIDEHQQLHGATPRTLAGDKNYHQKELVRGCRERGIAPHVACKKNLKTPGLDARTTTTRAYQTSQRVRKRIEEIFGWMKTVGGLRRSRYLGLERTQAWGYFVAGTYNLLRMARLQALAS